MVNVQHCLLNLNREKHTSLSQFERGKICSFALDEEDCLKKMALSQKEKNVEAKKKETIQSCFKKKKETTLKVKKRY